MLMAEAGSGGGGRPDVEERYTTATNASSLVLEERTTGPADVLVAAAWSPTRIGAALLRLHSEFDGGQRARQRPFKDREGKWTTPTDAKLLAMRLKTMPAAREQLTIQATMWEMEDPAQKARLVLLWWLDQVCPKCHGRKFQHVSGTPSLSAKSCPRPDKGGCGGSGLVAIPCGADGRKLANFLDDCVARARQSIKQRLRQKE